MSIRSACLHSFDHIIPPDWAQSLLSVQRVCTCMNVWNKRWFWREVQRRENADMHGDKGYPGMSLPLVYTKLGKLCTLDDPNNRCRCRDETINIFPAAYFDVHQDIYIYICMKRMWSAILSWDFTMSDPTSWFPSSIYRFVVDTFQRDSRRSRLHLAWGSSHRWRFFPLFLRCQSLDRIFLETAIVRLRPFVISSTPRPAPWILFSTPGIRFDVLWRSSTQKFK